MRIHCKGCERIYFFGMALHIPAGPNSAIPKDAVIPKWADDEYPFESIPTRVQESIPAAFFDPQRKIRQRGRVHVLLIEQNIYVTNLST